MVSMNTSKRFKKKTPKPKINPEHQRLFDELCAWLEKNGLEVRWEKGNFQGGFCLVNGKPMIFLNKKNNLEQNIQLILSEIPNVNEGDFYLPPRLKNILMEKGLMVEEF